MNALPHLMVGDLVWRRLNWDEETRGHFLIGSIAPDAYRSIPGTGFRRLHFRGRKPGQRPQDLLVDYVRPMLRTGSIEEQAFWLGWFGHLAADALWRRLLAHDMPEFWERSTSGAPDERARLRQNYSDACDSVDRDFAKLYPERIGELRTALHGTYPAYDVFPATYDGLMQWVSFVLASAAPPPQPASRGDDVVTYEFVVRATEAAEEEALALLSREIRRAETQRELDQL